MSESTSSLCKTISWVLPAVLLIGMTALYIWYDRSEHQTLAHKDGQIVQPAPVTENAKQTLAQSKQASETPGAQNQASGAEVKTAEAASSTSQGDMKAQQAQQVQTALATEVERHERAPKDAATAQEETPTEAKTGDEVSMAAIEAEHETETLQLEHQTKGRIASLGTTSKGSSPEPVSQLATSEQSVSGDERAGLEAEGTEEPPMAQSKVTPEQRPEQAGQNAPDLAADRHEGEEAPADVQGLFTEFRDLGPQNTKQGILLSLTEKDLQFQSGKAGLPGRELPTLDRIAELLLEYPKLTAKIEGYTDSTGLPEANLKLSERRAAAVKQALVERGVDHTRLTTEGFGQARPIADNATTAGRRKNRRVEIYLIGS
jgi:chemotaxis protein MotB